MKTRVISGPEFVTEALFGIGLSFGLTSDMDRVRTLVHTPMYERLIKVARGLAHKQGGHNKFLETIMFTLDVDAPRYWWQEFDTYRVGVTKQSESTMHTMMSRPFRHEDFQHALPDHILESLNMLQGEFVLAKEKGDEEAMKDYFKTLKNCLPEGFLQRRVVCINAKTLQNMYMQRKNHRLPEWRYFFDSISSYLLSFCGDNVDDPDVDCALARYCIFGDGENA